MELQQQDKQNKTLEENMDETPIEIQFKELLISLTEQKNQISNTIIKVKQLQKTCTKELKNKKNKKNRKPSDPDKKRAPSGFTKPIKLSEELCEFIGKQNGTEMARTEVTKLIAIYIKDNNLQLEKDKRTIVPDKKLSKLLKCGDNDIVTYFNLQSWMKPHYIKETSVN